MRSTITSPSMSVVMGIDTATDELSHGRSDGP